MADQLEWEVELEVDGDETELELELKMVGLSSRRTAERPQPREGEQGPHQDLTGHPAAATPADARRSG